MNAIIRMCAQIHRREPFWTHGRSSWGADWEANGCLSALAGAIASQRQQQIVTGQSPCGRLRNAVWVYGKEKVYDSIP